MDAVRLRIDQVVAHVVQRSRHHPHPVGAAAGDAVAYHEGPGRVLDVHRGARVGEHAFHHPVALRGAARVVHDVDAVVVVGQGEALEEVAVGIGEVEGGAVAHEVQVVEAAPVGVGEGEDGGGQGEAADAGGARVGRPAVRRSDGRVVRVVGAVDEDEVGAAQGIGREQIGHGSLGRERGEAVVAVVSGGQGVEAVDRRIRHRGVVDVEHPRAAGGVRFDVQGVGAVGSQGRRPRHLGVVDPGGESHQVDGRVGAAHENGVRAQGRAIGVEEIELMAGRPGEIHGHAIGPHDAEAVEVLVGVAVNGEADEVDAGRDPDVGGRGQ